MNKQWKGSGSKRAYTDVREEMMYISVIDTIQNLLDDPEVVKQVHVYVSVGTVHTVELSNKGPPS